VEPVHVERELASDPNTVFEWFTDPVLLTRWWPSEADIDLRPGGPFRMYWERPDVTLRGEYRVTDPGRRLDHTWSWDHDDLPPRFVSITFESADAGTRVRVEHECASESEGADYRDGWEFFLGRLQEQLVAP
jgi:uncharacterized protein YndB with AHSA1/START domain